MLLGMMQPYFFPYIGYWQLINAVDKYVIYDDVNFIKNGWINRNNVLMDGKSKMITLSLHNSSQNKHINEIEVLDDMLYKITLLKFLEHNYKKAPYYADVYPIIERVLNQNEKNLAKYLEFGIRMVCDYLSIDTEIIVASGIKKNNDLKGKDRIYEICKILGADEYINAIGGQKLYFYEDFAAQGIRLKFLKTGNIEYKQFKDKFVPNLSIIDVMMFNEPKEIKNILNKYEVLLQAVEAGENTEIAVNA